MNRRVFIAAAVAIFASGCNFHTTLPEADDALNQEAHSVYLDLIEARDDQLVARMSSENDLAAVRAQLPMLRDLVSHDFAPEPQVASYQNTRSTQGEFYVINQDSTRASIMTSSMPVSARIRSVAASRRARCSASVWAGLGVMQGR